jgi:hypothetical protein
MKVTSLPADTTREADHVQLAVLRRIGMAGRARMTAELCDNLRELVAAGVLQRHPDYTDEQIRLAVVRLTLGEELFRQASHSDVQP